jgi:hypothetical protein
VSIVFDAGALVAVERGDRDMIATIKRERRGGRAPVGRQALALIPV